jgi:16S rRNA (guanine966-N2)-methyltransferase
VRIIGGMWRSRRLAVPSVDGLRPTPDRVRETVFNWLQPYIAGARCLDLFAGTGALCLEALSRGAREVVMVEQSPVALDALRQNVAALGASGARVVASDATAFLAQPAEPFDILFVDPPFAANLVPTCLALIAERGWARPGGVVYIEAPHALAPPLPAGWELYRSQTAGQVGYHLARIPAGQ